MSLSTMDPKLLGQVDFLSVPNLQTAGLVDQHSQPDQPQQLLGKNTSPTSAQQNQAPWNPLAVTSNISITETPSTVPSASIPPDSFVPQSSGPTTLTLNQVNRQSASSASLREQQGTRPPPATRRMSGSRAGVPQRKRAKLSTDASPFDDIDYWIRFDNEQTAAEARSSADPGRLFASTVGSTNTPQGISSSMEGNNSGSLKPEDLIDDSALENALSDEDELSSMRLADQLSRIDTMPPSDVPPREGLYSTPLSWERPQPGLSLDPFAGLQTPMLSAEEQRRLIAIAMSPGPTMGGLGSALINPSLFGGLSSTLSSGLDFGPAVGQVTDRAPLPRPIPPPDADFSTQDDGSEQQSRASKSGGNNKGKDKEKDKDKDKDKAKQGDRTSHNDIERKYRTNLKDKIAELRDAVPSLSSIPENAGDEGEGGSNSRGPKVSKGTVLMKATEYIHYLEKKNRAILEQHQELTRRLQAFEQLLTATARSNFPMPSYSRTLFDPRAFC